MTVPPHCHGRSSRSKSDSLPGECPAAVRYVVSVPKRSDLGACGRHLSWLVDYRTAVGQSVTVTKVLP